MKNLKYSTLLVFSLLFSSCNIDMGYTFKIMSDLRSEFKFNYVEISESTESITFTLQDIDHNFLELEDLKIYSVKIDNYVRTKYHKINKYESRNYIFSGAAGIEIVKFKIDIPGEAIKITEL